MGRRWPELSTSVKKTMRAHKSFSAVQTVYLLATTAIGDKMKQRRLP